MSHWINLEGVIVAVFLSACSITVENYDIINVCTGDIEVGELFEKIIKQGGEDNE